MMTHMYQEAAHRSWSLLMGHMLHRAHSVLLRSLRIMKLGQHTMERGMGEFECIERNERELFDIMFTWN